MADGKKSFIVYTSWSVWLDRLNEKQKGQWLQWVMDYCNDKDPEEPKDPLVAMATAMAMETLKRDLKKYEERKERIRKNGRQYQTEVAPISERSRTDVETEIGGVNVNVNDNVNDNVNVNVNDNMTKRINDYMTIESEALELKSDNSYVSLLIREKYIVESDAIDIPNYENLFWNTWKSLIQAYPTEFNKVIHRFITQYKRRPAYETITSKVDYLVESVQNGFEAIKESLKHRKSLEVIVGENEEELSQEEIEELLKGL